MKFLELCNGSLHKKRSAQIRLTDDAATYPQQRTKKQLFSVMVAQLE